MQDLRTISLLQKFKLRSAHVKYHVPLLALLFSLSCTGCGGPTVHARSLYTGRRDLASYIIDTPDPEKETKRLSQKIWVSWFTPVCNEKTTLAAYLHFEDGSERDEIYPITSHSGKVFIEISPEEYRKTGGILSYKILLRQDGVPVAVSQHKLWAEKVEITEP